MFTLNVAPGYNGKNLQFVLTREGQEAPVVKSMEYPEGSTAKMVKALVSMLRRVLNQYSLNLMKTGSVKWADFYPELHALGKTFADWLDEYRDSHPTGYRHPMVKNLHDRMRRAAFSADVLYTLYANSDEKYSTAHLLEALTIDGVDVKVRMSIVNMDDRRVQLTARLLLPNRQDTQGLLMSRGGSSTPSNRIELTQIVLRHDVITYHELLTAMRKMPVKALMTAIPSNNPGGYQ